MKLKSHLTKLSSHIKGDGATLKALLHGKLPEVRDDRGTNPLHASTLMDADLEFCPRAAALAHKHKVAGSTDNAGNDNHVISAALSYTFLLGRLIETALREEWLRDEMVGDWTCKICGVVHPFSRYPGKVLTSTCHGCRHGFFAYREHEIFIPEYNLSCAIDAFVWVGKELVPVEVKSMDKDLFRSLKAPVAAHRARTALYMWAIDTTEDKFISAAKTAGNLSTEKARILYMSKSFGFKDGTASSPQIGHGGISPFKEFVVEREDAYILPDLKKAKSLKNYYDTGKLPKGICGLPSEPRARACLLCSKCFIPKKL